MSGQPKKQITQRAYERLKQELDELEGEGRERIIEEIARARAHGDLSENAEYHAARDQQGLQESRARQIRHMLQNSEIIDVSDDGVVKPGMLVTIRSNGDEETETYLLGLREEKGGEHDVLTPDSPIGQSLIGRSAGETVRARVPAGDLEIEIVAVQAP
ncbi:MAG: transcription elongation factor GreA [Actinomycetota bacterium]|nr:transcription elongation factor GreA [Actinomycetota bacterium]